MLTSELLRAEKCIEYLEFGAPSFQMSDLGPCSVKNSTAAFKHGIEVTDSIAAWIVKGFVAGPFFSPPLEKFRSNLPFPNRTKFVFVLMFHSQEKTI